MTRNELKTSPKLPGRKALLPHPESALAEMNAYTAKKGRLATSLTLLGNRFRFPEKIKCALEIALSYQKRPQVIMSHNMLWTYRY